MMVLPVAEWLGPQDAVAGQARTQGSESPSMLLRGFTPCLR